MTEEFQRQNWRAASIGFAKACAAILALFGICYALGQGAATLQIDTITLGGMLP